MSQARTGDDNRDRLLVGRRFEFADKGVQMFNAAGQSEGQWNFRLDSAKNPKQIDLEISKKGQTIVVKGIYALEGGRLKLCWASDRKAVARPKDFTNVGGKDDIRLFILNRAE